MAFLGRLNPLGALFGGLVLAICYLGGEAAQVELSISEKTAQVFQGMLLFFILTCDTLIRCRVRLEWAPRTSPQPDGRVPVGLGGTTSRTADAGRSAQ